MARKFRFQRIRTNDRKDPRSPHGKNAGPVVLEPLDIALIVIIMLVAVWLQWLMGTLSA